MKKIYLLLLAAVCGSGMAMAQDGDYLPLLREGVKWVYLYQDMVDYPESFPGWYEESDYNPQTGFFGRGNEFYYFTIQGEETVDGLKYKRLYCSFTANFDFEHTEPIAFVREENRKVYAVENKKASNQFVKPYHFTPLVGGIGESVLYDFGNPAEMATKLDAELLPAASVTLGGSTVPAWILKFNEYEQIKLIEGIGPDGISADKPSGMDWLSFPCNSDNPLTCMAPTRIGLVGVMDADGNYIYKGTCYTEPARGDLNGDGRVDVEDVNALINIILKLE